MKKISLTSMKYYITIPFLLLFIRLNAQENKKKISYYNLTEISIVYGGAPDYYYYSKSNMKFSLVNGIRFKNLIAGGIGLSFLEFTNYDFASVSLDIRYKPFNLKSAPFLHFNTGYIIPVTNDEDNYNEYSFEDGFSSEVGIGIENRLNENIALQTKIGYNYQKLNSNYPDYYYGWYQKIDKLNRLTISIAMVFK